MPTSPSRLPPYVVFGPITGLICFYLYISIPGLNYEGIFKLPGPNNPFSMAVFAYIIGALPAALTALILDIFQRKRPVNIVKFRHKIFFSAVVGFLTTFVFIFSVNFFIDGDVPVASSHPLSLLHFSIYGACSGIVCEFIYVRKFDLPLDSS